MRRVTTTDRRGALRVVTLGRMVFSLCMAPCHRCAGIGCLPAAFLDRGQHDRFMYDNLLSIIRSGALFQGRYSSPFGNEPSNLGRVLPSGRTLVSLGAAVGFAMSFKYVGAAFFAIALPLTLLYPSGKLDRRLLRLDGGALMVSDSRRHSVGLDRKLPSHWNGIRLGGYLSVVLFAVLQLRGCPE